MGEDEVTFLQHHFPMRSDEIWLTPSEWPIAGVEYRVGRRLPRKAVPIRAAAKKIKRKPRRKPKGY